jgi:hypothetical protein
VVGTVEVVTNSVTDRADLPSDTCSEWCQCVYCHSYENKTSDVWTSHIMCGHMRYEHLKSLSPSYVSVPAVGKLKTEVSTAKCNTTRRVKEEATAHKQFVIIRRLITHAQSKTNPATGRGDPHGCETSRLLYFLDNRLTDDGEVVSLTRRPPFTPRKIPDNYFGYRLTRAQGHSAFWTTRSIEKSNDIMIRTRDFTACSIVPQPTTLLHAPCMCQYIKILIKE